LSDEGEEKIMRDLTRAANHLTLEQVKEKMKVSKDTKQLRRWQIVYTALLQPRKAEDIATCVGVSKSLVQKIISCYNREGIKAIEIKSCGGRYHEYLSIEEEEKFLICAKRPEKWIAFCKSRGFSGRVSFTRYY
jgi:hypothetical protein